MSTDYAAATYYGAHPYNHTTANRPSSDPVNKVIVHVAQGNFSGTINWFKDTRSRASAHYTVGSKGEVGQSVYEKDIAWHAGSWEYNRTGIGIEHEGYVNDPAWFTPAMYDASARLCAAICKKYRIPADRSRIIGHNEVPYPNDHTDPGFYSGGSYRTYWDWTKYISLVRQYVGSYTQVIDNSTAGAFSAAGSWGTGSSAAGRYGANYRYRRPGGTWEPAGYKFYIPATANYNVYGWWPANSGYNATTRFGILTSAGWKSVYRDQRTNGGRWVHLGTFYMTAGARMNVFVASNSASPGYIIADAIRLARA